MDTGATGIDGAGGRRTADSEHADPAIRGRTRIAKPRDARDVTGAPSLHAVIAAEPALPVHPSRGHRARGRSSFSEPRDARETAATEAFHTVGVFPKFVAPSESPNSRTARLRRLTRRWLLGAAALTKHPDTTVGGSARIGEACYAREAAAAKALHTVSVVPKFVAPSEAPNSWTTRLRRLTRRWLLGAAALTKHPDTTVGGSARIGEACYAREAAGPETSYAIGTSTPGLADDPRARWPPLPINSSRVCGPGIRPHPADPAYALRTRTSALAIHPRAPTCLVAKPSDAREASAAIASYAISIASRPSLTNNSRPGRLPRRVRRAANSVNADGSRYRCPDKKDIVNDCSGIKLVAKHIGANRHGVQYARCYVAHFKPPMDSLNTKLASHRAPDGRSTLSKRGAAMSLRLATTR